jgi:deoxycytidylate deaminase
MYKFDRLVSIAKDLKATHQTGRAFHCAFLLKKSKIVKIAVNNYNKTSPVSAKYKHTKVSTKKNFIHSVHAESSLLGKLKYEKTLAQYKMVVIRIENNNRVSNSCPCISCLDQLLKSSISQVFYSTSSGIFNKLP